MSIENELNETPVEEVIEKTAQPETEAVEETVELNPWEEK